MLINNVLLQTSDIVPVLNRSTELPAKTYRIKLNGKFALIKGKGEWTKLGNAKIAVRAFIRRHGYQLMQLVNPNHNHGYSSSSHYSNNYYYLTREDWSQIYEQLVADKIVEFVEITNA